MTSEFSPGDKWPGNYRGYRLQTNPNGEVWWQVYQGTDRIFLEPTPDDLLDKLTSLKRLGGRVRVTEDNTVITKVEDDDEYEQLYVGELSLRGRFVPREEPDYSISVRPDGLEPGDLWTSVYDGAKFSFVGDRIWWTNPATHKRHPVEADIPDSVVRTLQRLKPNGGSFRITPWNDVLTLVSDPPNPDKAREQLQELPRVIKNIIVLRRERGVEMLPVYAGSIESTPVDISEPRSLTDELSPDERAKLNSWAGSVGPTSDMDPENHQVDTDAEALPEDDPENW
jgi:hypothetical protein